MRGPEGLRRWPSTLPQDFATQQLFLLVIPKTLYVAYSIRAICELSQTCQDHSKSSPINSVHHDWSAPTIGSTIAFENHLSFVEIAGCSRQYEAMRRSAACILVFGAVLSAKFYTTPM